jgi:alpha-methylacyl-CoA racemase
MTRVWVPKDIPEATMSPLNGVRVIEFAGIGPAPFAAMILSDMGADVLRIERVDRVQDRHNVQAHKKPIHRGRRSICVNLKKSEAVDVVLRLASEADVLIEGFRPGVMERLGLGPDVCLQHNPGLIYGRVTGWGQEGPLAQAAGHDINYIALAGVLDAIGRAGQAPVPPLNLVGDFGGGGMLLAFGVVCALLARVSSGRGQVVDAAMIDGATLLMTWIHGYRAMGLWNNERGTNLLDSGAHFYDVYACQDGKFISIAAIEPKFYTQLLNILGLDQASFPPQMDRTSWPAMKEILVKIFLSKSQSEWCEILEGTDVCFAPVLNMDEAPDHPHVKARSTYIEIAGITQAAPAPRFSQTVPEIPSLPPEPGEHTDEVLHELGFSREKISRFHELGVIA